MKEELFLHIEEFVDSYDHSVVSINGVVKGLLDEIVGSIESGRDPIMSFYVFQECVKCVIFADDSSLKRKRHVIRILEILLGLKFRREDVMGEKLFLPPPVIIEQIVQRAYLNPNLRVIQN